MKLNKLKQNKFIRLFLFAFIFLSFTAAKFDDGDDDIYVKINKSLDVFGRIYKEIALNYVDEIETDKFMKAGIEGMLNTLDPYTNFLDESRKDEMDMLTTGKYGGIGITVGMKDSMIIITDVLDGYSAQKEGIKRGDKIIEIDGVNMLGKNIGDIRGMIRGTPGSQLKMKVKRTETEIDFLVTRQEIKLKNVTYSGIVGDGIGLIKLERFNKNAETEMIQALNEIKSKGELKGVILDLRDNPGGLLDAAIGILNKLVDKDNLLLTTKGRKQESERKYFSTEVPIIGKDIPLVVLVNQNTASASEILSGAIQDLDRGVVIGTKSFGKGLVQVFTPLSYGNQLKITNQKYFTPSGRWIQSRNYFKENKFGVFKPNPYFNQTEFKTLNGRTVYAEGGITPDSIVRSYENNELLDELLNQEMYYKFAQNFALEHPDGSSFEMNDEIVNVFYSFINREQFTYQSSAETALSQLKSIVDKQNYSDNIKSQLATLENELKSESLKDFDRSKPLIKRNIEVEILKRYNKPEKEISLAGFKEDIQLQIALNIINNRLLYDSFLRAR